jgi:hypothetical protein
MSSSNRATNKDLEYTLAYKQKFMAADESVTFSPAARTTFMFFNRNQSSKKLLRVLHECIDPGRGLGQDSIELWRTFYSLTLLDLIRGLIVGNCCCKYGGCDCGSCGESDELV